MANTNRPGPRLLTADDHQPQNDSNDGGAGQGAPPDAQGRNDQRAGGGADTPEATRRIANAEKLTEALDGVRNSNFAILKELRTSRKYRAANPPRASALLEGIGDCEQCGTTRATFDDLVHHQMTEHPEIFIEPGALAFENERCLCAGCSPGAFGEWARQQPAPTTLPKKRVGSPPATKG